MNNVIQFPNRQDASIDAIAESATVTDGRITDIAIQKPNVRWSGWDTIDCRIPTIDEARIRVDCRKRNNPAGEYRIEIRRNHGADADIPVTVSHISC